MALAFPVVTRVEAWDAAIGATRRLLRERGLCEVSTPVRVDAPAIEPYIEPVVAGAGWLQTSPELAMKRLLCAGSGPIFQIAHVFRKGERGALHAEEFHLVEWYRTQPSITGVLEDVEAVVEAVLEAVSGVDGIGRVASPRRWERVKLLDAMEDTLGSRLPAQGDVAAVFRVLEAVREKSGVTFDPHERTRRSDDADLELLWAWTELFSLWCDIFLGPFLASRPEVGVHIVEFPAALAALSRVEDGVARRFESHVHGLELANGYEELRDAAEQRRRFERVNALRAGHGLVPLPLDELFLAVLDEPGLPACSGVALGLDRLVMLACGADSLDQIQPL